jgi:hypothetical protein
VSFVRISTLPPASFTATICTRSLSILYEELNIFYSAIRPFSLLRLIIIDNEWACEQAAVAEDLREAQVEAGQ